VRLGYLELARSGRDIVAVLAPFSPAVEPDGSTAAYFDADGMDRLFGPLPRYGRRILAAAGGVEARLGIGPGKWFAWAAARRAEPGAVRNIAPAGAAPFASDLPLDWLPLPAKAVTMLTALGIRTVGQFAALPSETLAPRLGRESLLAHRIAGGDDPRPLEPPLEDTPALLAVAADLLAGLCRPLRADGRTFGAIALALESEDGRRVHARRHLAYPADTAAAATILRAMVEELARAPVAAVTVTLTGLAALVGEQLSLLPDVTAQRHRRQRVERTVDELLRRYPGHLGRLTATAPHAPLPEQRWRFAVAQPGEAVRLVRRGRRRAVYLDGRWETVVASQRVWQVDLWWPRPRRRRYVRIETRTGRRLTLYYDSLERGWFLADRLDEAIMAAPYAELHLHSCFSLLDGACQPDALAARASALG